MSNTKELKRGRRHMRINRLAQMVQRPLGNKHPLPLSKKVKLKPFMPLVEGPGRSKKEKHNPASANRNRRRHGRQ